MNISTIYILSNVLNKVVINNSDNLGIWDFTVVTMIIFVTKRIDKRIIPT